MCTDIVGTSGYLIYNVIHWPDPPVMSQVDHLDHGDTPFPLSLRYPLRMRVGREGNIDIRAAEQHHRVSYLPQQLVCPTTMMKLQEQTPYQCRDIFPCALRDYRPPITSEDHIRERIMAALKAQRKAPLKLDLMPPRAAVQGLLADKIRRGFKGQMTGSACRPRILRYGGTAPA